MLCPYDHTVFSLGCPGSRKHADDPLTLISWRGSAKFWSMVKAELVTMPSAAAPAPMAPKKPAAKPGAEAKKPAAGAPGPAATGRHLLASAREAFHSALSFPRHLCALKNAE